MNQSTRLSRPCLARPRQTRSRSRTRNSTKARSRTRSTLVLAGALGVAGAALPAAATAQGWIEPPPPLAGGFAVDRVRSEVTVTVDGPLARFEVNEWFVNDGARVAEGDYVYPLPGEAVFEDFSLYQDDEELRGEIMDAEEARRIYEEIVRRRKDPALIEYAGSGLLRARVFPIEPGGERRVTIRYVQRLARSGSGYKLVHAGAVRGGRPAPRPRRIAEDAPALELRPLPEPVDATFNIRVLGEADYHDPFSPTHELDLERRSGDLFVHVADFSTKKLALFLPRADEYVGVTIATHAPAAEDGFFMLTLSPGDAAEDEAIRRDVTAVLDVSGSMAGSKIVQARGALHQLLGSLGREDRFRLVAFSNRVLASGDDWHEWGESELGRAREWVDALVANGGTDIGAAITEALRLESPADRLPVVVFLTDGLPTSGETSPEIIADRAEGMLGRARIFAFGVGNDVNTHLLDRLGEAGRGSTDYVSPGEDVERAVGDLARRVSHPALTDLVLDTESVEFRDYYPVRVPDVFVGQELVLFGRYTGSGDGSVTVTGRRGAEELEFRAEIEFPESEPANGYVPRLWAARKLGYLERQVWTEGESADLVQEIRALALRYGLPSRYTSYLVREPLVIAEDFRPPPGARSSPRPVGAPPSGGASLATGRAAVEAARAATRMRGVLNLDQMTVAARERAAGPGEEATRWVGGRAFVERDGAWVDIHHSPDAETVTVELFSDAWFVLVRELPEIAPIFAEMTDVTIAGVDLSMRFTESVQNADNVLGMEGVAEAVRAFRGGSGPP